MKWSTILIICAAVAAAQGCATRPDRPEPYDHGALERLYRADLARADRGEPDAMMRMGRYHDNGLGGNGRCDGAMAPLCRIGAVSRWLSGTVVAPDRARAYKWYSLAALHEYRNALAAKQSLMPEMTRREIEEGERMIAEWLKGHRTSTRQRASGTGS